MAPFRSFPSFHYPARFVLRGRVVTLNDRSEIFESSAVCIRDDLIEAVLPGGSALPDAFIGAPEIETEGTIYPGLIDLHNHLAFNFLPLWAVPELYTNRNQWKVAPAHLSNVSWPFKLIAQNQLELQLPPSVARFVECRALFGGITTSQGIPGQPYGESYTGLVRNVETPADKAWPAATVRTDDFTRDEIKTVLVPQLKKTRPYIYHLSEGTDTDARQRFLDLKYLDWSQPLEDCWAINDRLIGIHAIALTASDHERMATAAGIVWSPLSNLLLYGQTADVLAARDAGVRLAIGCDWSPSGSKNLLGELKIARIMMDGLRWSVHPFSNQDLVRMVTSNPAALLGWDDFIGTVEPGKKADLLVLSGTGTNAYDQLINAREDDVELVMIGGRARIGRASQLRVVPSEQETVKIGSRNYVLDLTESGSNPLAGLSFAAAQSNLKDALADLPELAETRRAYREAVAANAATLHPLTSGATNARAISAIRKARRFMEKPILIRDEYNDRSQAQITPPSDDIDPEKVHPMLLEPPTEVDDSEYRDRLKASKNLPQFVKEAL